MLCTRPGKPVQNTMENHHAINGRLMTNQLFRLGHFQSLCHKLPEARYGGTLIGLKWAIILVLLNDLAIATSLADFIENDGVKIATAHFPLTILQSN